MRQDVWGSSVGDRQPRTVDRLVVHQFDPASPVPGGIDTCLRGLLRYLPEGLEVAVVGVDAGLGLAGRRLGRWERHQIGDGRAFWFLPVVRLDPADQARSVPHSLRLLLGLLRHRRRLPEAEILQVHRMDSALALRALLRRPQVYLIHTQENGLVGTTSDSFWRFAGGAHRALERAVVRSARDVVVFNEGYSEVVRRWNPRARFSPTWFDPALTEQPTQGRRDMHRVLWVGRLEVPKDPALAIRAFAEVVRLQPDLPWRLDLVGSGTLGSDLVRQVADLPPDVAERVGLAGRVPPSEVAAMMKRSGVFLMTSHAGYEGFPRVLVEAMACGLPAVVTEGSDTGGLVVDGRTGYVGGRVAQELGTLLGRATRLDRQHARNAVAHLSAPTLVSDILDPQSEERKGVAA